MDSTKRWKLLEKMAYTLSAVAFLAGVAQVVTRVATRDPASVATMVSEGYGR